jgi:hypothetical protein
MLFAIDVRKGRAGTAREPSRMPIQYLREFTAPERTDEANRRLGRSLAFVAGAANAGGFLVVGQYTSHMSGVVSSLADNLALGSLSMAGAGLASLVSFVAPRFYLDGTAGDAARRACCCAVDR